MGRAPEEHPSALELRRLAEAHEEERLFAPAPPVQLLAWLLAPPERPDDANGHQTKRQTSAETDEREGARGHRVEHVRDRHRADRR